MKSFISAFCSVAHRLTSSKTRLAVSASLALALLGASVHATRTLAADDDQEASQPQVAEILQLLSDFHGALSYGGNITAMMNLWAENSSITLNGTEYVGKPAVESFFTSGGYFLHNWVSLAPEYKTQITLKGNTAEASTQCVAIDLSVTPMVVRSVIQVNATAVRHHGKWLFTSMNNTTPAPL